MPGYIYIYIYFIYIVSHSSPIKKKKNTTPSGAPHQTPGLAPGALMTTMVKNRDSQWINVDNGIYREHRITKLIFFLIIIIILEIVGIQNHAFPRNMSIGHMLYESMEPITNTRSLQEPNRV